MAKTNKKEETEDIKIESNDTVVDSESKKNEDIKIIKGESGIQEAFEIKMTLETFLNHFFLKPGNRLYYLKTFGKDREEMNTFSEWSTITGKK